VEPGTGLTTVTDRGSAAARKERTRRDLLEAACDAFARKGYAGANVDDIVSAAGVARGTFYLYFKDKRDVFSALVDDLFARISANVRSIDVAHPTLPPVEQLRANLLRIAALSAEEPALLTIVLRDTGSLDPKLRRKLDAFYKALHAFLDESLAVGQRIGLVRDGDRRALVRIALGGLKELLWAAAAGELDVAPEALADEMMRFLASGLLAPPPASAAPRG
jgi:AcrR family transcriptional regulator